jgi:methionyl-tRNA synthetase
MPRKLFVTTALPYANAPLHVGHIADMLYGDIWVRFKRMQGHEVNFVCASDAHGAPIMLRAESEGIAPDALITRMSQEHDQNWQQFLMSFDHWHTTHSPENVELAQGIYKKLKANKLITTREIEQFYDPVKGMFLADRYIKGECPKCGAKDQYGDSCEVCGAVYAPTDLKNPYSTLTGAKPVMKSSEHFFFKLSDKRCVDFLKKWVAETKLQPEVVNKLAEWLGDAGSLSDWDISRDAPYFGIEIPDAPGKYFYVWLDAPVGYLASLKAHFAKKNIDFDAYLADPEVEQYHFIGKDIIYFHTLFWPAMLHFSGRKVPNNVFVHGFITLNSEKMSKSRGTGISPQQYVKLGLNPEWFRYYIATKISSKVEDFDFNPDDFFARVNSDLIGKYVNIASRCAGFLTKYFDGKLSEPRATISSADIAITGAVEHEDKIAEAYDGREYGKAIRHIMAYADQINQYVQENAPWELAKDETKRAELHEVCSEAMSAFFKLTVMLKPILPATAEKVETLFCLKGDPLTWADVESRPERVMPYKHLMARIERKQVDALIGPAEDAKLDPQPKAKAAKVEKISAVETLIAPSEFALVAPEPPKPVVIQPIGETISIDDFGRIDLRVAKILDAEFVQEADKLLKLTLDLGIEQRTVFAGIRNTYNPKDLIGRLTVTVANLAPRKMRFGESQGMVLAAGDGTGLYLLAPDSGAVPGMRIK